MPKLHELLAVNANKKGQADKCRADLTDTFNKKRHLFTEKLVTFKPTGEGAQPVTEEQSDLQTTVAKELKWVTDVLSGSFDVAFQIAVTNTVATADLILENGKVLAKSVPATALLELETRLNEVHALVLQIPTLDPAKGYRPDTARGEGVYVAREDVRTRTKKTPKVLVLAPATEKHAAQVQVYHEDEPTGTLHTIEWSGLVTVSQKGDMLDRVESLRRSVKAARARANSVDAVIDQTIGQKLLDYVFRG